MEGTVTEEEYFQHITRDVFPETQERILVISLNEDILAKPIESRSYIEKRLLTDGKPLKLAERLVEYKTANERRYDFSNHPEDEFWMVIDVDNNWEESKISNWNRAVQLCQKEQIRMAISNPFFEVWLLMHFCDLNEEDAKYAITSQHRYQKTNHFQERIRKYHGHLKDKHIKFIDKYTKECVLAAISRAKGLHQNYDTVPEYLCSTVYLIIESISSLSNPMYCN